MRSTTWFMTRNKGGSDLWTATRGRRENGAHGRHRPGAGPENREADARHRQGRADEVLFSPARNQGQTGDGEWGKGQRDHFTLRAWRVQLSVSGTCGGIPA